MRTVVNVRRQQWTMAKNNGKGNRGALGGKVSAVAASDGECGGRRQPGMMLTGGGGGGKKEIFFFEN
jgi:hypothetical protein